MQHVQRWWPDPQLKSGEQEWFSSPEDLPPWVRLRSWCKFSDVSGIVLHVRVVQMWSDSAWCSKSHVWDVQCTHESTHTNTHTHGTLKWVGLYFIYFSIYLRFCTPNQWWMFKLFSKQTKPDFSSPIGEGQNPLMYPGKGNSDVGRCQNSAYSEEGIDGDGTSRSRVWMGRVLGARWPSLNSSTPSCDTMLR